MDLMHWQTAHRAYEIGQHTFVKRELKPCELLDDLYGRKIPLPRDSKARLQNEYMTLQYLRNVPNVPIPGFASISNEAETVTLTTSRVAEKAIALSAYNNEDRNSVIEKVGEELIKTIIPALRQHKSNRLGGLDGQLLLPPRLTDDYKKDWPCVTRKEAVFVLCHNDLGQDNIFIDPDTHKIQAIVDWEYAGFYPEEFEAHLWRYSPREQDWGAHKSKDLLKLLENLTRSGQV